MQQSRRNFVATVGGVLVTSALGRRIATAQGAAMFAYVGGFGAAAGPGAHRKGINVFRVDPASNQWTHVQQLANIDRPNILALDRRQRYLYVSEGPDRDFVSAFSIDARSGELTLLNRQPAGGTGGMYAVLDPTNRYLIAPHVSGNISVHPIQPDGSLGPMSDSFNTTGTFGPHKTQQITPQPHHIVFDRRGRFLLVPSKGFDTVHVFTLDTAAGKLVPHPSPVAARSGAAPRHLAFHPTGPYAYVINELDSTVTTYRFDDEKGTLEPLQVIPSLPTTFTGQNTSSAILMAKSGRFVYTSNRGHDSIGIFAVDSKSGVLAHAGWESTRGRTPRFICFDPAENFLYAANQASHNIAAFRVNQSSGALSPQPGYVAEVDSPTAIVFTTPGATTSSR